MSVETGHVCCNCRHCERRWDNDDHDGLCQTYCDIDGHYIGYIECHTGWCRHWSKETGARRREDKGNENYKES